ncbi:hypothetical protein ROZALSC1DRAFT_29608, partial [Rozella allomycis CSF55]
LNEMRVVEFEGVKDVKDISVVSEGSEGREGSEESDRISESVIQRFNNCKSFKTSFDLWVGYKLFLKIKNREMDKIKKELERYENGLKTIKNANKVVNDLSREAEEQEKELIIKQTEADESLKLITFKMNDSLNKQKIIQELVSTLNKEEEDLKKRRIEIENELMQVEPAISKAKEAIGKIKNENLSEIRSLRSPPSLIRDLLEGVLMLMGIYDTSWTSMKSFLGKKTVKDEIINFDARNINKETRKSIEKLIQEKSEAFDPINIKRSFVAAEPLVLWLKAQLQYSIVIEKIKPLEGDLNMLNNSLNKSRGEIEEKESELKRLEAELEELRVDFSRKTSQTESLKIKLGVGRERIEKASMLLSKLRDEQERWSVVVGELEGRVGVLDEFVFKRVELIIKGEVGEEVEGVEGEESVDIVEGVEVEGEVDNHNIDTLSASNNPVDVALMRLNETILVSLIRDPLDICIDYLKDYQIINYNDSSLLRQLELAMKLGNRIAIRNMNEIPSYLGYLISNISKTDEIKLLDKEIKISSGRIDLLWHRFKLVLITKNKEIKSCESILDCLTIIDFNLTRRVLSNKFLDLIVNKMNPENQLKKEEINLKQKELNLKLIELEDELLKQLSETNDLLSNEPLLLSLEEIKIQSLNIKKILNENLILLKNLQNQFIQFKEITDFASRFYFACEKLKSFNSNYFVSVKQFEFVLLEIISIVDSNFFKREFVKSVLSILARFVVERDQLAVYLFIVKEMYEQVVNQDEWDYLKGNLKKSKSDGTADGNSNGKVSNSTITLSNSFFEKYKVELNSLANYYTDLKELNLNRCFKVSWLHSILIARKSIIPIGFLKDYEFSDTDFKIAIKIASTTNETSLFKSLLISSAYGPKIDNKIDLEKLVILVNSIFNAKDFKLDGLKASSDVNVSSITGILHWLDNAAVDDFEAMCLPANTLVMKSLLDLDYTLKLLRSSQWLEIKSQLAKFRNNETRRSSEGDEAFVVEFCELECQFGWDLVEFVDKQMENLHSLHDETPD